MGDFDFIVILGIIAFVGYIFYRQFKNYLQYREAFATLKLNHHNLKVRYYLLMRILFIVAVMLFSVYLAFFSEEESRLVVIILMFVLALNEAFSLVMFGRLFYNDEIFFFNGSLTRYRSIKEIKTTKSPFIAKVILLNNEEVIIPRSANKLIEANWQQAKKRKKR